MKPQPITIQIQLETKEILPSELFFDIRNEVYKIVGVLEKLGFVRFQICEGLNIRVDMKKEI